MTEESILENLKEYCSEHSKGEIKAAMLRENYNKLIESSKQLDLHDQDIRNKLWNAVKLGADHEGILTSTACIVGKRNKTAEEKVLLRSRNTVNNRISRYFKKLMRDLKAPGSTEDQIRTLQYFEEDESDNRETNIIVTSPTSVTQLPAETVTRVATKRARTPKVHSEPSESTTKRRRASPKKDEPKVPLTHFLSVYKDSRFKRAIVKKLHELGAAIGELLYRDNSFDDTRCEWKYEVNLNSIGRLQIMVMRPDLLNLRPMSKNGYKKLPYSMIRALSSSSSMSSSSV
jgi:hypothetical protein